MTKMIFCILLVVSTSVQSQQYSAKWGDELKMNISLIDYEITGSDTTGYYFIEKRVNKVTPPNSEGKYHNYFKITKFDSDLKEVWDYDYFKPLAEFDVFAVRLVNKELIIFMTDYKEKEKRYKVYTIPVDMNNGKPAKEKDFKELAGYERGNRREDFLDAKLLKTTNGYLVIGDFSGKEQVSFTATVLDNHLNPLSSTLINMDKEPDFHLIHDVKYINGRIVILTKVFEKAGKKKSIFKNFMVSVYDVKGVRLTEMPLDMAGKFTIDAKLLELTNNEAGVAGIYSNDGIQEMLSVDGCFISRIDEAKQKITMSSEEYFNPNMFPVRYAGEWDAADKIPRRDSRMKEKNKTGSETDISIRSVDVSPSDGRIIISAEFTHTDFYEHTTVTGSGVNMNMQTDYLGEVKTEDILLVAADNAGIIKWLKVIPKQQREVLKDYSIDRPRINYFHDRNPAPYHSSFKALFVKDDFILLYNDHKKNVTLTGDSIRTITDFEMNAGMFKINVDPLTGNYSKSMVSASSNDEAITVPHHAYSTDNIMIVPARKTKVIERVFLKLAKFSVN